MSARRYIYIQIVIKTERDRDRKELREEEITCLGSCRSPWSRCPHGARESDKDIERQRGAKRISKIERDHILEGPADLLLCIFHGVGVRTKLERVIKT